MSHTPTRAFVATTTTLAAITPLPGELAFNTTTSKLQVATASGTYMTVGTTVSFSRSQTSGTKIATITIDGTATDIYAPTPTAVSMTQILQTGTEVAAITIGSETKKIYAPLYAEATTSISGLMSSTDKAKLDGITTENFITTSGTQAITSKILQGQLSLQNSSGYPLIIGAVASAHLSLNTNRILALSGTSGLELNINDAGGAVNIGSTSAPSTVNLHGTVWHINTTASSIHYWKTLYNTVNKATLNFTKTYTDSANASLFDFTYQTRADGTRTGSFIVYVGSTKHNVLSFGTTSGGAVAYVTVPTPAAGNNSTQIATTAWVQSNALTSIRGTSPITVSGSAISHATSGVTAASYGPSANASPSHGETFSVPYLTVNATGHVTACSTKTITLPTNNNTDTKVTQTFTANTVTSTYNLLFRNATGTTTNTDSARFAAALSFQPYVGDPVYGSILWMGNAQNPTSCIAMKSSYTANATGNAYPGMLFYDSAGVKIGAYQFYKEGANYHRIRIATTKPNDASNTDSSLELEYSTSAPVLYWKGVATNSAFCPVGTDVALLGNANYKWKQLYASTTTISTSDERLKSSIQAPEDALLDAWGDIKWLTFKMNDAVEEKGEDAARIHSGLIAQRVAGALENRGLDPHRYAFFCYDHWNAKAERRSEFDNSIIDYPQEEGDQYSLRYEEALAIEAAYQRRRADRLEAQVADLARQVAALTKKFEAMEST